MDNEKDQQILEAWKKSYLEAVIDSLQPSGDVLEVGFGLGDAANRIQTYHPKSHIIIESDPDRVMEARVWARSYSNVSIISNAWEKELPLLGQFDAIFFGDYSMENDVAMLKQLYPQDLSQISGQAKELLNRIEEELSRVKIRFTDQQIEEFYEKMGQQNLDKLPKFFNKLKDQGNISDKQHQGILKKYYAANTKKSQNQSVPSEKNDPMLVFLEACFDHMHKGSRFSSVLSDNISKYEDSMFFEKVITNPELEYRENSVVVDPKINEDFKFPEALVMVVEKMG